jgi:plastocyanin
MIRVRYSGLAVVLVLLSAAGVSAEEWGTLKGRFVFDGKAPKAAPIPATKDPEVCGKHELHDETLEVADNGGLENAVIFVRTEKVPVAPEYEKTAKDDVVLDNKNCRFEPHVVVLRTSQTLVLKNSDPVGHNSKLDPLKNTPINPIIPAGQEFKQQFPDEETLPIGVGCNIHPWMKAYVVVRSNPYAAVADKEGNFEIKDLPAGKELEFQLWHEKPGFLKEAKIEGVKVDNKGRFKLKIKPGENKLGEIKPPAKLFK